MSTLLISEKIFNFNTFFLGMSFFLGTGMVYHWYLLDTLFKNQQQMLLDNQQYQYQLCQQLLTLIKSQPSPSSLETPLTPLTRNSPMIERPTETLKVELEKKKKDISPPKSFDSSRNGYLSELKEVLRKREHA